MENLIFNTTLLIFRDFWFYFVLNFHHPMFQTVVLSIIYVFSPVLLLYGCKKVSWLNKFGTVSLAYVLGIVLGNIGLIKPEMKPIQDNFTAVTIALALPLLLFSINLKQWSRLAAKTGLAVIFGIISVLAVVAIGFYIFENKIADCWKVSGLMVGVYIGGTANMAAISTALKGNPDTFILVNAYDIIICMFYFFFLITIAQKLVGKFLIPFRPARENLQISNTIDDFDGWDAYRGITNKKAIRPLALAILLSAIIVGIAMLMKGIFPKEYELAGIILTITSISIVLSLIPAINKMPKTFPTGMYLIIIFCIVVGSMADFRMFTTHSLYIAAYISMVIVGSLLFQIVFSKIFRIDTDTTIITSVAFIFSAPFVPTVANSLKNKEIILSGITIGIIGYTTGNFLGISLAYFLR